MAVESRPGPFGELLRKLRVDAAMTQEELAEATGLSVRAVSDLERGINRKARKETARLLAGAFRLEGAARAAFEAAARGTSPAAGFSVTRTAGAIRALPRDAASFTGREQELRLLVDAVSASADVAGIFAIGGMAGSGKTTFAVHAAHQLAPRFPDGQIFLSLHGHTPGHRPVDPAEALTSLLLTTGVRAEDIPAGPEERAGRWRARVAGQRLLLLLDDAVDSAQVRPLIPGDSGILVLITSRRHLTGLDDARAISLETLSAEDAVTMLVRLAGRAESPDPDDRVLPEIARLCGYLPLALGMIGRQFQHHPAWVPADLRAELETVRDRLGLMAVEHLSVSAAFDLSYRELAPAQRRLFRKLGLHPAAEFDGYAAAALDGAGLALTRRSLDALYEHYLLAETARGRYRMHDLIREHARALAATDPDDDAGSAIGRLLDYYVHAARSADNRRALYGAAARWGVTVPVPADVPAVPTWDSKVAWMRSERQSLSAAIEYAAAHGRAGHAAAIADAMHVSLTDDELLEHAGILYAIVIEAARTAGDAVAEAAILANRSDLQRNATDYQGAIASLDRALLLFREHGHEFGEAWVLSRIGRIQYLTDDLKGADSSLGQALALYAGLGESVGEAGAARLLGAVRKSSGDYPAARTYLTRSMALERSTGNRNSEAWAHIELGSLEMATSDYRAAAAQLAEALNLARALGNRSVEASALLHTGELQRQTGDFTTALGNARRSLELSVEIGHPLAQANALHLLGLLQTRTGDYEPAAECEEQALAMYQDMGNQEGTSEVLFNMGELAMAGGSPAGARTRYEQAATVAAGAALPVQEAQALDGIGRSYLADGQPDEAAPALRQALRIFRKIGSPRARDVEETLREHAL
jgi:tetratricopeptide (TPR) repeat protein/transcriptional regulator with XRE-family HTH domain